MDVRDRILSGLNERQIQAVTTTEGPVRIIAGAGSGKTRALISRYSYLVEVLGIDPSSILCVTFTNKAAKEMRTRVRQIVGEDRETEYICTYHGFCVKVLREDINKVQYPKKFIIADIEDQKSILKEVYHELGLTSRDLTYKNALEAIKFRKHGSNYLDFLLEDKPLLLKEPVPEHDEHIINKVFQEYLKKQKRNFALDFDDLILFTMHIFDKYEDIRKKWQQRLHYIMVDEMQDSSPTQFSLVDILSRGHDNLFVVGDPDQTIYEWRGASPKILLDFCKDRSDAQTVIMDQNYRSTPDILDVGNNLIGFNRNRIKKDMFTDKERGAAVIHFHAKSDSEEGGFIADEIHRLVKERSRRYSDFAVLYRAHTVSRRVEQAFIKADIPYSIWGGIRFFERKEIKDVLSYLRLIEYGDDISFLRVINEPSRKLGKVFIDNIKQISDENGISLFEATELNPLNRKGAIEFVDLINRFRERKDSILVSDLIKEVMDETGLTELYRKDGDEERLDNLLELQNSIIELEKDDVEPLTLDTYLQDVALYTDMDADSGKTDRVRLMTIHTSKGLEFPVVFLCGFNEGVLPNYRSVSDGRIEEERRLAYVAITRAEEALYMTESEGHTLYGSEGYPSRFLLEIREDLYVRKGVLPQYMTGRIVHRGDPQGGSSGHVSEHICTGDLEVGDTVFSKHFGKGEVTEKDFRKRRCMIRFEKIGRERPILFEYKGLVRTERPVGGPPGTSGDEVLTEARAESATGETTSLPIGRELKELSRCHVCDTPLMLSFECPACEEETCRSCMFRYKKGMFSSWRSACKNCIPRVSGPKARVKRA